MEQNGLDSAANLPIAMIMLTVCLSLSQPVRNHLSRQKELQADRYALELSSNPAAFIPALQKLGGQARYDLLVHPFRLFWSHSHPAILSRILAVNAWLRQHEEHEERSQ